MNRSDRRLVAALLFLAGTVLLLVLRPPNTSETALAPESGAIAARPQASPVSPQLLQSSGQETAVLAPNRALVPELDFEAHAEKLREEYGDRFSVIVEKPFVVLGDGAVEDVDRWAKGTIRWAIAQIKALYFEKEPDHIINIWLFKDKQSYEANTKALFGSVPETPYGYYSPSEKVLVMNISTGGGTLVHEIVHPFMAANFEKCPSWFNEGLASLYEQSGEQNGKIVGYTNWRLRGLQLAIKDGLLGSFERMMSTSDREFYDGDSTNYAQARYLCYWLQQNGLLQKYYHQFAANADDDPEGIKTLKKLIEVEELGPFQKAWEKEVLKLRFP